MIEGLDNKLIFYPKTENLNVIELEQKEKILKSFKNGTKNMDLVQMLFHDKDLYSNKYNIINMSIIPKILKQEEADINKFFGLNFIIKGVFDDNLILKIKNDLDNLIMNYHNLGDLNFIIHAEDQINLLINNVFNHLKLERIKNDYYTYKRKTSHYELYKKQFNLVYKGLLKTVLELFEIVWLRCNYFLVIYLNNLNREEMII